MSRFLVVLSFAFSMLLGTSLSGEPELFIHNRVLAKVKDKTISLYDVVKQMDLSIHESSSQTSYTAIQKYQFYSQYWKHFLDELINNELMLLEANSKEIKVSDGDVREEMLRRFGPNVHGTLSKLHLTYEEAREIVHTNLVAEKIQGYNVHAVVFHDITPERIRNVYQVYLEKHPRYTKWNYQFVTIKAPSQEMGKLVAEKAYELLSTNSTSLEDAVAAAQQTFPDVSISLSRAIETTDAEISAQHKAVLEMLPVKATSAPQYQVSRSSSEGVIRLFHLKEKESVQPMEFKDIQKELRDALFRQEVTTALREFTTKLRQKYDISDGFETVSIPDNFVPFELSEDNEAL